MNLPRRYLALAVLSRLLLLVHGALRWHELVPSSGAYRPRPETSFTACGSQRVCLIGGRGLNYVDILHTTTMTWTRGATNPLQMHHVQALEGPDGCAWLAGAWTGPFPDERTVDDVWRYCADTDSWSIVTAISRPRGSGGAVLHAGLLYLVSGNVGGHNTDAVLVPWFDVYDPATGAWTTLPDVPHPRDHFHIVVVGGRLYVGGGRDSTFENVFSKVEARVDVFDFASGQWTQAANFPRPRGGTTSVVLNKQILTLGGEADGRAWGEVDIFDPASDTYSTGPLLPVPRHGTGAVACAEGAVYISGGATVLGCCDNAVETYVLYDDDLHTDGPPACSVIVTGSEPTPNPPALPTPAPTVTPSVSLSAPPSDVPSTAPESPIASPPPPVVSAPADSAAPSVSTAAAPSVVVEPGVSPAASPAQLSRSAAASSQPPSPTPDDDTSGGTDDSQPACFPGDALVTLRSGSMRRMSDVRVGDDVLVSFAPYTYSRVYFLSHANARVRGTAVHLTLLNDSTLAASPGHLVYVNGRRRRMADVRPGDLVTVAGRPVAVSAVRRTTATGRFNPHTLHGDIVVNGVVASTYTTAVHPVAATALLLPFRIAFHALGARHPGVTAVNEAVLKAVKVLYWRD